MVGASLLSPPDPGGEARLDLAALAAPQALGFQPEAALEAVEVVEGGVVVGVAGDDQGAVAAVTDLAAGQGLHLGGGTPCPGWSSTTVTASPRPAARQAIPSPITPPPTMTTSGARPIPADSRMMVSSL